MPGRGESGEVRARPRGAAGWRASQDPRDAFRLIFIEIAARRICSRCFVPPLRGANTAEKREENRESTPVGTGSSRKSATNSVLWHFGDDIPYIPNKRSGGVCIGGTIAPIFFNTMEDSGALPKSIRARDRGPSRRGA
jgi:hypothetical protein